MRVTGNRLIEMSAASTSNNQATLAGASEQVTSGLRVGKPSDDPVAWMAAQRAALRKTMAEGSNVAVQNSLDRLQDIDGAMATIGDAVSQIRSLAIQGNNDSYNADDRAQLAVNVRALMSSALAAANTRGADGEYLLAGRQSLTAPFAANGAYSGDASGRDISGVESGTMLSNITGAELTAANGIDIFPAISRLADALAANDTDALETGIGELESAIKQISLARTRTGSVMSVLDSTATAHADLKQSLQVSIARHVEIDSISAASELAKHTQAFEVSRAVTSHVLQLIGQRST